MKVRIIGTSSKKYIDNFKKLQSINGPFLLVEQGINFNIVSQENKNNILIFKSNVTRKQNIEIWIAFGLIEYKAGIININVSKNEDLISKIKKSLLEIDNNIKIQSLKNMKMLVIEYLTGSLNENMINHLKIEQLKGNFNKNKILKEASNIEREIAKDDSYILKLRRRFYE